MQPNRNPINSDWIVIYQPTNRLSLLFDIPTDILYGSNDHLVDLEVIREFADKHHASLTIMDGGEHWFHTAEQMAFLKNWIIKCR